MSSIQKEEPQDIKKIRAQLLRATYEKMILQQLLTAREAAGDREET